MASFNTQFIYSVIIILVGYLLKRFNILKEKDGEGLSRLIFNLTLPCLLIVSFDTIKMEFSLLYLIIISFLYGIFAGFLGLIVFKKETRKIKGMLAMMVPGFNIGLFAFPLVEGIWGSEGLKYFSMFDLGNSLIVFGLIYLIASFHSDEDTKIDVKNIFVKLSRCIPLMTYIIVCILNILGFHLPGTALHISKIISQANMPLSLLLLGFYLNFSIEKAYFLRIGKYLALRYFVGLGIGILLYFILPFGDMFKYTVLMGFILPMSFSVLVYAVEFEYDEKFVGTVSNLTILISFALLWGIGNILL